MDIEKRLTNLENLVNSIIKRIDKEKYYSDADTAGIRQSVSDVTPYTESKTAYIDDAEVVFERVPEGNLSVYVTDAEGNAPTFTVAKTEIVRITFAEPLTSVTTVTISIS